MTDDLSRVLADIDSLLPPGAPSCDDMVSFDAMRWSPVDHDNHPDPVRSSLARPVTMNFRVADVTQQMLQLLTGSAQAAPPDHDFDGIMQQPPRQWPAVWTGAGRSAIRRAMEDAYTAAIRTHAQRTATNLQHLRDRWDQHGQAQAVIEARRNRNTGPSNPRGIDGRARRHQHPRKAAARNASPATQGSATPVILTWRDGALALGFDPAWQ